MAKRRPKTKPASGIEKKIEAKMRATNLMFQRFENVQKRIKGLAKRIYAMPPAQRATAIVTFNLMTGKKDLRRFLESDLQLPPSECDELEPLLESIMMDLQHAAILMEDDEVELHDLKIILECESEILSMMSLTEEFEFGSPQRLSVAVLNEELKRAVKGGGKVASSDKGNTKQMQLKRFFSFYEIFNKKLTEFGIASDDERTAKFLVSLMNLVPRIQLKRNEEAMKNHGK